jgi:hypothetical protein
MQWTIEVENVIQAIGFGVPIVVIPLSCFFCSIYAFDKRIKRLFAVTIGVFVTWLAITAICVWLGLLFGIAGAHTIWPLTAIYFGLSILVVWVLRSAAKSLTLRSRADRPQAAGPLS